MALLPWCASTVFQYGHSINTLPRDQFEHGLVGPLDLTTAEHYSG